MEKPEENGDSLQRQPEKRTVETPYQGTQMFPKLMRNLLRQSKRKFYVDELENWFKNLTGHGIEFSELCQNLWVSSELTSSGAIRNRSDGCPEFWQGKPGIDWGAFPGKTSNWSQFFRQQVFSFSEFGPWFSTLHVPQKCLRQYWNRIVQDSQKTYAGKPSMKRLYNFNCYQTPFDWVQVVFQQK